LKERKFENTTACQEKGLPIPAEVPADATGALFEVAAAMAMAEPVGVVPADPAEPPAIKAATPKAKTSVKRKEENEEFVWVVED
jgi:hypothetical protein